MLQIRGELALLDFDMKKYSKTLNETIETQMRQAAREWLRAVIPKVPVWTGTARGTLAPLGRFLRVAVPINPVTTRENMGPDIGASKSSFQFLNDKNLHSFVWDNDVLHYLINEYNDVSGYIHLKHPVPWRSLDAGNQAFDAYINKNLPEKAPKIKDFVNVRMHQLKG